METSYFAEGLKTVPATLIAINAFDSVSLLSISSLVFKAYEIRNSIFVEVAGSSSTIKLLSKYPVIKLVNQIKKGLFTC